MQRECLAKVLSTLQPDGAAGLANATVVPYVVARWADDVPFAQQISHCRTPVIVANSLVSHLWAASSRWTDPDYVAQKLPVLQEAYAIDSDEAAERLAAISQRGESDSCEQQSPPSLPPQPLVPPFAPDTSGDAVESMPTTDFYEAKNAVYFARWMGFAALAPLRDDVSPHAPLLIHDGDGKGSADVSERRYFRLGSPGAISSLHYDEYHNMYAQLVGTKRWWLLPPAAAWHTAMSFPRGHGRARQSPRSPVHTWPPADAVRAGVLECVTAPGELLYIPPYWAHQTATTATSVAINVWSPSNEARQSSGARSVAAEALLEHTRLLDASMAAAKQRTLCLVAHQMRVGAATLGAGNAKLGNATSALRALYAAQHAHLRMGGRAAVRRTAGTSSSRSAADAVATATAAAAASAATGDAGACGWPCEELPSMEESASAQRLAGSLMELPEGVRSLTLGDVVAELAEHLAATAPVWPGERGRARAVRCLLLQPEPDT